MIHISGNYCFDVPRELVWQRIFDPDCLMNMIPGCRSIVETAPGEYHGRILIGVAAVRGEYQSSIKVLESKPVESCSMEGEIGGQAGIITGQAMFRLADTSQGCQMNFDTKGIISGALGSVNKRFIEGTAQSLIRIGLGRLNKQLVQECHSTSPSI